MSSALALLHDAARRRDSADVVHGLRQLVLQRPGIWDGLLVAECEAWGDDGAFVMRHVVLRDGNVVTFGRLHEIDRSPPSRKRKTSRPERTNAKRTIFMNVNGRFELPDLVVYVGAQTEEAGTRIAAEIEKIIRSGRAGTRKGAGFIVSPMPIEYVTDPLRGQSQEQDRALDELNVFVSVNFRGSKDKACWVAENIHREMGPDKVDVYFRQFHAGWSSLPMTDERAKELAEKELRAQHERVARQAAGPS